MIVRINQHDLDLAERSGGWATGGLQGPIQYIWPPGVNAMELLVLETDERNQILARTFRQMQIRQLIPETLLALKADDERIVLRLDGPMDQGELLRAFEYLTDSAGVGRYCLGPLRKLQHESAGTIASVRLAPTTDILRSLCTDANLGLDRGVRLRAFCVAPQYVNMLLTIEQIDDDHWPEVLEYTSVMLSTARTLPSLHVLSRHHTAMQARQRLMARLLPTSPTPKISVALSRPVHQGASGAYVG